VARARATCQAHVGDLAAVARPQARRPRPPFIYVATSCTTHATSGSIRAGFVALPRTPILGSGAPRALALAYKQATVPAGITRRE
jgi:hypothetical protein